MSRLISTLAAGVMIDGAGRKEQLANTPLAISATWEFEPRHSMVDGDGRA
jgi:hypothetical protein